jgi:AcrR family transcriptional regulator
MLSAMAEVASERGAASVTVADVVARSGVSRRTFYELFSDREDCFLAAFDDAITRIANEAIPAYEQPSRWRERIRAALTALLEILDYEPGTGRLVIVETLGAGPKALERPVLKAPARPRPANSDPLRELEMRLTYRTVRVLMAVAANLGSSNRTVADGAGIKDQGQMSKLLARLAKLGLIENTGEGSARGGPNAWALTERGVEVENAIAHQTKRS